ncbi:DUF2971 domain-containing protein [Fibrobacter sp.]|uniref:DUF2971 domain-containing protein n=1 Tax=Fibrobacter sp. TaxID=35828 RepID=UPI003865005B
MISKSDLCAHNTEDSPRFLYHYTKVESAIKILKSGKLLLRAPEKMNDPHEYRLREINGILINETLSEQECHKAVEIHSDAIKERKYAVRMVSFSTDQNPHWCKPIKRGWNRVSMWTYYAESHAGVCLIFDRKRLEENFSLEFSDVKCRCFCRPIQYVNDDELEQYEDMFWEAHETYLDKDHVKHLFTKLDDYAPEQEYRLLLVNSELEDTDDVLLPIKNSICGIITGDRFKYRDEAIKKTLHKAITESNEDIRTFEMNYDIPEEPLYGTY